MLITALACAMVLARIDDDPRAAAMVHVPRLMETIRSLPTKRSPLGDLEHQRGLIATEELITARLKDLGYEPRLEALAWNLDRQRESDARLAEEAKAKGAKVRPMKLPESTPELASRTWHNIAIEIPGRSTPDEVLLVGAHFDAVANSPGADDNASGVAALLELARVLKDRPLSRSVRLVFFNLEELGLKGSGQYLREHRKELATPEEARADGASRTKRRTLIAMISLEMIGFYCVQEGCQKSPVPAIEGVFTPPTVGDSIVLATTAAHTGLAQRLESAMNASCAQAKTFRFDIAPVPVPDLMRSDHAPFLLAGFPALMLTDTANFRNPNYHSPKDTIDTLDADRYGASVRALAGAIEALAGVEPPAPR